MKLIALFFYLTVLTFYIKWKDFTGGAGTSGKVKWDKIEIQLKFMHVSDNHDIGCLAGRI